jgi:hypothetical protein
MLMPKYKFHFTKSYEGQAMRRISEIMNGLRCVYCLGPVTPESPRVRIGKLAVCSQVCGFNTRGTTIIDGSYDNIADYPVQYKIEKPAPLT